jgi:hypothetical protein
MSNGNGAADIPGTLVVRESRSAAHAALSAA